MNFIADVYAASKNFAVSSSRIQNNSPFCGCTRAAGKFSLSCKILCEILNSDGENTDGGVEIILRTSNKIIPLRRQLC